MKKVLIVSYFFPPDPLIGSLRVKGIAKYLPEFGWEPIILSKNLPDDPNMQCRVMKTQFKEYDSIKSLQKKFGFNPGVSAKKQLGVSSSKNNSMLFNKIINVLLDLGFEIVAYPDAQKKWYSHALKEGNNFLTNETVDAIISSSHPVTCHLVAHDLKMKHKIPWIADLRDLWSLNHYNSYTPIRKYIERRLEKKTFQEADALSTVSTELANSLSILHKQISVHSIPNGFDLQDIDTSSVKLTNKFTITYTGSLYGGKRDPYMLFESLAELIAENKLNPENIEIRFYGSKENWMHKEIEHFGLNKIVNDYGLVSRDVALEKQKESQLLLLLLWDHPSETGVYTGKIFDYLAAKRPILAIGGSSKGVVYELLEETKTGYYSSSIEDTKKIIQECYNEYQVRKEVSYNGDPEKRKKYSQREMARKFAIILNKITDNA